MRKHTPIHPASPMGAHPSMRSPGLHEFTCTKCGDKLEYTNIDGSDIKFNNEVVGYYDPVLPDDYCVDCEQTVFGDD